MKSLIVFIFSFLIFFPIANAKERIFVSFYPLEYSVKFLVGDSIDVWNPVDSDPADWAPSKAQIKKIQESKLIFINGAGFEKWPKVVALPKSKLVVTSRSFKKSWLRYKKGKAHSHGGKVHIHRGFDGHTWMSPNRFLMQNKIIYETIKRAKLVDSKLLDQRFNELQSQFNELEKLWLKASRKITESGYVFTNHPAYNYLAKDYGFKVKNFDVSPGENFTKKEIATLKKGVQHHKGTFFWWESAPSESQEKFIKEVLRLENKVVSPSEVQGGKDFYETMRQNVSQF